MTERRELQRLFATAILSSALLLAGCGRDVDDSVDVSQDPAIESSQDTTPGSDSDVTDDPYGEPGVATDPGVTGSDATDPADGASGSSPDVLTDGTLDLDKVESELEAIERELDSLVFPDDSMFNDAEGALF